MDFEEQIEEMKIRIENLEKIAELHLTFHRQVHNTIMKILKIVSK